MVGVGEEPQRVVEERPSTRVVFVVLGEALLDVGEARTDAVLVPLQRQEIDGVGEVRREELVALCFEPGSVGGEVGELLIPPSALLIERGVDFGREVTVVVLANRDAPGGVFDQPLGNLDGHGPAGAGRLLGGAA